MDLNICIVHYNSAETIRCLESLAAQTVRPSVVLVNNASTDASMEPIRAYANTGSLAITILEAPSNGGFAAGNNIALRWAHRHTPEAWNMLLNNDTLLPEDFVEQMIASAETIRQQSSVPFALSVTEYDGSKRKKRHTGMQYLSLPTGWCFASSGLCRTPYLCGACVLLDPRAPLWDESYFLYFEDADYAKRLQANGYRLLTTDATRYYHIKGATTAYNPELIAIQMTSMWRYYRTYYPRWMPVVRSFRVFTNLLRGRMRVARIINHTYHQA